MHRNITEVVIAGSAAAGGFAGLKYLDAGMGLVIGLFTIAILGYRLLITRREWRDGRKRKDPSDLP